MRLSRSEHKRTVESRTGLETAQMNLTAVLLLKQHRTGGVLGNIRMQTQSESQLKAACMQILNYTYKQKVKITPQDIQLQSLASQAVKGAKRGKLTRTKILFQCVQLTDIPLHNLLNYNFCNIL